MGVCQTSNIETNFPQSDWITTRKNAYCSLVQHRLKRHRRLLKWFAKEPQDRKLYHWREESKESHMCKIFQLGDHDAQYIITQQLVTLNEIHLNSKEAQQFFWIVMESYLKLADRMGWFFLDGDKIFVNGEGKVRIWVNSNLANNNTQLPIKQSNFEDAFLTKLQYMINSRVFSAEKLALPEKYTFHHMHDYFRNKFKKNPESIRINIHLNSDFRSPRKRASFNYVSSTSNSNIFSPSVRTLSKQQSIDNKPQQQSQESLSVFPHKIKFITNKNIPNKVVRDYTPKKAELTEKTPNKQSQQYQQNIQYNFNKINLSAQRKQHFLNNSNEQTGLPYFVNNSSNCPDYKHQQFDLKYVDSKIVVKKIKESAYIGQS